jgi:hypothetical protein
MAIPSGERRCVLNASTVLKGVFFVFDSSNSASFSHSSTDFGFLSSYFAVDAIVLLVQQYTDRVDLRYGDAGNSIVDKLNQAGMLRIT